MCPVLSIDRTVSADRQQIRTHRAVPANLSAFNGALIASDALTARPGHVRRKAAPVPIRPGG